MSRDKGTVNWSQETSSEGLSVGSRSLRHWLPAGGFSPWPPTPAPPSLCPASAPDSLPLDTMLSVFLVLPLILFFKG